MDNKYAIIDIEAISLWLRGKPHNCLRKVAVLLYSDEYAVFEAQPCVPLPDLTDSERKTFDFCYDHVHHLSYYPSDNRPFTECANIPEIVKDYLEFNNISIVYYKGGCLEKDLCEIIGFESRDLEKFGVQKAQTHDPLMEVKFFKHEFERIEKERRL